MSKLQNEGLIVSVGSIVPTSAVGSVFARANTALTTIDTEDVFVDLNLDSLAAAGSNINLWSVTDTTTGEITYNGGSAIVGSVLCTLSALSPGATNIFEFRVVKNGSVLSEDIMARVSVGGNTESVTILAPVSVENGDTIRIQVADTTDTFNISIREFSLQVS